MRDEFQHPGVWYLPSRPRIKRIGTLRFSQPEGVSLDLVGLFGSVEDNMSGSRGEPDVIIGTANNRQVTLYRCARGR